MKKNTQGMTWTDLAKKIVYASLGTASVARDIVLESKLPKDMLGSLMAKAEARKEEVMTLLAREVSKFLDKINVSDEIAKALKNLAVDLEAKVTFHDRSGEKGSGVEPKATIRRATVRKSSGHL